VSFKRDDDQQNTAQIDAYDASHLFWDEIQRLDFAFRDLQREDVSESDIEEFLHVCEPVWTVLNRIQKKKKNGPQLSLLLFNPRVLP